ncbi:MAG TPA: hypothetical protein VN811_06580 [Thermoanaerobaculia bacterium]|nr:hypothetical protein [Thermoanaerobaculia bacterium]
MLRRIAQIAAIALLAAAPLAAAEVYVPALNPAVANDSSRSATELWISNNGTATASFTATYLEADTDGTRRGATSSPTSVLPGASINVTNVAQSGKVGLVAIELGTGLAADARLLTTAQNGAVTTSAVPVISDANKFAAGAKAELLNLVRDPEQARLLHFGVVNLGRQAAECKVDFFQANSSRLVNTITLAMQPLSLLHFNDAFGILQVGRVSAIRAEVSCNQPFYAYGAQFLGPNSHYLFITPAQATGIATTPPPPPTATCGNGAVCYDFPGIVHTSTLSNPDRGITLSPPVGVYSRLKLHLEVQVNGFYPPADMAHGMLYLVRDKNKDMFANVFLQGPGTNQIVLRHGFNLTHPQKPKLTQKLAAASGTTYALDYLYDPAAGSLLLTLKDGGVEVVHMAGVPNVSRIQIASGNKVVIGLSNPGVVSNEPASIGWVFKNLHVELIP